MLINVMLIKKKYIKKHAVLQSLRMTALVYLAPGPSRPGPEFDVPSVVRTVPPSQRAGT